MNAPSPTVYVVAVTRWAGPVEAAIPRLSPELGLTPYDLRLRLAGSPPTILERTRDQERARRLLAVLRGDGHGAVACDVAAVRASQTAPRLRGFAFDAEALWLGLTSGERHRLPFAEIVAIVRTLHVVEEDLRSQTTERKLSVSRAVLTSGLQMTTKVTKETHDQREAREQVAYVYSSGSAVPWLLREHELHYEGLGERRGRATSECFRILLELLTAQTPLALHDDRCFHQRRRDPDMRSAGGAAASVTTRSNAAATDLAAHLLVLAHARGML